MIGLTLLNRLIDENTEERLREFKLQFLLIYTAKSWFQGLRRCGIEVRTWWDQEKREGRCLDKSICLISNSNALERRKTLSFIVHLGVPVRSKRSTVTMKRSIVDRFEKVAAVRSGWTVWMIRADDRYKTRPFATVGSWSDDHDAPRKIESGSL